MKLYYLLTLALSICAQVFAVSQMPMEIVNNSGIPNSKVYFIAKGLDPVTGKDCFVKFDANGNGTCVVVNDNTDVVQFSYPLSKLSKIKIPKISSGRLYLSIGYPMDLYITKGENKIIDTDGFKPRDSNYYTLHDKIEFSYTDNGTWINPTAVDFFSLPIRIEQQSSQSGVTAAGLTGSRDAIFTQLHKVIDGQDKTINKIWSKLFLTFPASGSAIPLRIVAPGKAMVANSPGTKPFDKNYLNDSKTYGFNYIDFLWNYYKTHDLVIDASEIKSFFRLNDYFFTGRVNAQNEFVFSNLDGSYREIIAKPATSTPFFAGAGDEFNSVNNTPKAIIVRQLTSAFEVGLLPAPTNTLIDRNFFLYNKASFFTANPLLIGAKQGPWYDLYSKALHSFGKSQPIYAFAYDDALGQDGTLHDPNAENISKIKVTLGKMVDTRIPNPYADNTLYDVQVLIGADSTVLYNGARVNHLEILHNVKIPFTVTVNGHVANIYFKYPMVRPYYDGADGIVIEKSTGNNVTVIFPGLPK